MRKNRDKVEIMKLYYYAFTSHKYGLDRMKRGAVILKGLEKHGIDTMLLVSDFRAGLVARDFGINESVTIEGIQDIDAIAEIGDSVIIDSPEDDHGRLVKYCSDFKSVFRFAEGDEDRSIHGETLLKVDCQDDSCISSLVIDDIFFQKHTKEERTLFFIGDSDADKLILNNANFFKEFEMELLLGNYFYVKYEDDLGKIFKTLHEADEYTDLICSSSKVVTSSFQTALDATVSGAEVTFIEINNLTEKERNILNSLKISLIKNFNIQDYKQSILKNVLNPVTILERNETIVKNIINRL
jgi:hypothetical protein